MHHPKRGIDAFLELHRGEYKQLTDSSQYQVVIRKLTEIRIGFLVKDDGEQMPSGLEEALGYGINVAPTVDSAYAVGAAVTIRSAVETTPERITFYIVDCGLSSEEKDGLCKSVPARGDVTMVFLSLPEDGLAKELNTTIWAKLDLCHVLPVERVLYLDADLLIRSSLKPLWEMDLEGKTLGAALDVGHPVGHGDLHGKPYFNAGVMLLDLAKARLSLKSLKEVGRAMKDSLFKDQDTLNVHFTEWKEVSLVWNAQGLGTYANYPSDDRRILNLKEMAEPNIVHFTGPVHPPLPEALNPYVQPPTCKPWGYLEASGHPFRREWWQVLERTAWKGLRESSCWKEQRSKAIKHSVEEATKNFHSRIEKVRLDE
ncbi:glycosyl transferase family 8 [Moniliophthora roreri MCA 2997]|uniref:Glycosyl transferase family 8 n=2 Tax=Moniliophthora roreri TaxID=221103 RepID=V2YVE0_MONRO|nr:glycosyl transferase family 8 [Moniliophthora roreri MCA 2997]